MTRRCRDCPIRYGDCGDASCDYPKCDAGIIEQLTKDRDWCSERNESDAKKIEQLEADNTAKECVIQNYRLGMERTDTEWQEMIDRIEELEALPHYHHPDCNYWKWDWQYSWDVTDCNCDEVAGPLQEKTDE